MQRISKICKSTSEDLSWFSGIWRSQEVEIMSNRSYDVHPHSSWISFTISPSTVYNWLSLAIVLTSLLPKALHLFKQVSIIFVLPFWMANAITYSKHFDQMERMPHSSMSTTLIKKAIETLQVQSGPRTNKNRCCRWGAITCKYWQCVPVFDFITWMPGWKYCSAERF